MGTLKTLWSTTECNEKNRALLLCCPSSKDGQLTQVHKEIPGKLWGTPRNDWLVNVYCARLGMSKQASLLVQWLAVCLVMQGSLVPSLVWEDPTCLGATKAMLSHNN